MNALDWNGLIAPDDRRQILRGERPELTWPEASLCPLENGDLVVLEVRRGVDGARELPDEVKPEVAALIEAPLVTLTVLRTGRAKSGAVVVEYRIRDDRDSYLRRGFGSTTSIHEAADELPKVDRDYQRLLDREGAVGSAALRMSQRERGKRLAYERRLLDARSKGKTATVRTLMREIDRLDRAA